MEPCRKGNKKISSDEILIAKVASKEFLGLGVFREGVYAVQEMTSLDRVAHFGAWKGNNKITLDEIAIARVTSKKTYVCLGCWRGNVWSVAENELTGLHSLEPGKATCFLYFGLTICSLTNMDQICLPTMTFNPH